MTLVRTTTQFGPCAKSFSSTTRATNNNNNPLALLRNRSTALGVCSVAVALVIITSSSSADHHTFACSSGTCATPSLSPLTLLVLVSVLVLYAIGNASWLSLAAKTVDDVVLRVVSSSVSLNCSSSVTRITSTVSASSLRFVEFAASQLHTKRGKACDGAVRRTLVVSARDHLFLSTTTTPVANLSLADLGDLARFTIDMNRLDFNKQEFLSTVSDRVRAASSEISKVIALSRGAKVAISTPPIKMNGTLKKTATATFMEDADALAFCAFCRIFAEWRSERLVPPGYTRYAAGMALAKRDLIQNLQKIETAVHCFLNDMETRNGAAVDFANGRQLSSPTLGCLMKWEKDQGLHPRLPNLTDRSGASGLLWTQRQLQYQLAVFNNLLLVPSEFLTSKDAVNAAYKSTYDLYHGFIIKQMFLGSFDAAPEVSVILNHMNNGRSRTAEDNDADDDDLTTITAQSSEESSTAQEGSLGPQAQEQQQAIPARITAVVESKTLLEVVAGHLTNEWLKVERFLKQCHGQQPNSQSRNLLMIVPEENEYTGAIAVVAEEPKRNFAVARPPTSKQTSEEEIPAFVAVAQPMLTELKALLILLNMNDPSKC